MALTLRLISKKVNIRLLDIEPAWMEIETEYISFILDLFLNLRSHYFLLLT